MPNYNKDKYIGKAIESVLSQCYTNWELIILDDASADNSLEVISKYLSDPRIILIRNLINMKSTYNYNHGITISKGKYIAILDSDDVWQENKLYLQNQFMEQYRDHGLVGSAYYVIDNNGSIVNKVKVLTENDDIQAGLLRQNWFGHSSIMYRRDILLSAGKYNPEYTCACDYDTILRVATISKVANLNVLLYYYRTYPDNNSNVNADRMEWERKVVVRDHKIRLGLDIT